MPSYTIGLDLGQSRDPSALCVVEHVNARSGLNAWAGDEFVHEFEIRALRRWELGTPYPVVVADVAAMLRSPTFAAQNHSGWDGMRSLNAAHLRIDATGVGRAVSDLFRDAWHGGDLGGASYHPVTITAQIKEDLASKVIVAQQRGRLHLAPDLALAGDLQDELVRFRRSYTASGRSTFDIARSEDGHGDLAMALMLALWGRSGWEDRHANQSRRMRDHLTAKSV